MSRSRSQLENWSRDKFLLVFCCSRCWWRIVSSSAAELFFFGRARLLVTLLADPESPFATPVDWFLPAGVEDGVLNEFIGTALDIGVLL